MPRVRILFNYVWGRRAMKIYFKIGQKDEKLQIPFQMFGLFL